MEDYAEQLITLINADFEVAFIHYGSWKYVVNIANHREPEFVVTGEGKTYAEAFGKAYLSASKLIDPPVIR